MGIRLYLTRKLNDIIIHHYYHQIDLLNKRQNSVAQTEISVWKTKSLYKSVNSKRVLNCIRLPKRCVGTCTFQD